MAANREAVDALIIGKSNSEAAPTKTPTGNAIAANA